jgi:hypothetical protein
MFQTLFENKLTMRESIFRILEGEIKPLSTKPNPHEDQLFGQGDNSMK